MGIKKEDWETAKKNADFIKKALRAAYCMDYITYVEVMHNGVFDYYSKDKWDKMQRSFLHWFCDLDDTNSVKFILWVMEKHGR